MTMVLGGREEDVLDGLATSFDGLLLAESRHWCNPC